MGLLGSAIYDTFQMSKDVFQVKKKKKKKHIYCECKLIGYIWMF